MPPRSTPERFWSRFERDPSGCLVWTGARTTNPHTGEPTYGVLVYQGEHYVAHRLAWILTHGSIPEGQKVLHKCDNPPCGEPSHLFLGTLSDNMVDRRDKGRHRRYPGRDEQTGRWLKSGA